MQAPAVAPANAASTPLTHRPLRSNQPPVVLPPTTPGPITDPPGAPPYAVVPRQHQLTLFPCSQCHKLMPVNAAPRQLVAAPHPAALQHGQGRMWCLDCHMANDRDALHGISGNRIGFNDSSQLCAAVPQRPPARLGVRCAWQARGRLARQPHAVRLHPLP